MSPAPAVPTTLLVPARVLAPSGAPRPFARLLALVLAAAGSTQATGCLSDSYRLPDTELQRLTSLPPEQRGDAMRVVQRTSFSSEVAADPAPAAPAPDSPHVAVFVNFPVVVVPGPPVGHFAGGPPRPMGPAPVVRGAPGVRPMGGGPRPVPGGGMPSKISGDKDLLVLAAVAAVGFTVGAVVTEGARFDGLVAAHPAHPLHLVYADGSQRVTTLWELTPPDLLNVNEAVLSRKEGPIVEGARAPLDRQGFALRLEGGFLGANLPTGERTGGAGMTFGLGYFPLHWLGFLAHGQFAMGSLAEREVLDTRIGLEADAFPLALGPLHIGGYGEFGYGWLQSDGATPDDPSLSRAGWSAGAGGLLELALTTRLALVGRIGETFDAPINGTTPHALAATLGFSVY